MKADLSTHDLRTFLAVAGTLSFSQAATQLHLSQSAVSSIVLRTEAAVQARLFQRTTRKVSLTAAGEQFVTDATEVLARFDAAVGAVRDISQLRSGSVAVAALPSFAAKLMPDLFAAYSARYPDIRLRLIDTLSAPAFALVQRGEVDFALTAADPAYADLTYQSLTEDRFVLLMPRGHPLAGAAPIPFASCLAYPHVSMSHPTSVRQYVAAAALQHGVQFSPAYEVDHLMTVAAMVMAGCGVAALPSVAAAVVAQAGLVQRDLVDPVIRRPIGLVWRADRDLSPAARAMADLLLDRVGEGLLTPDVINSSILS
ncbi:LysR family transcriptional regulator [Pigmentiphaga litoralis]|jgi:DNA-binding transcriptional LysR family regulator|uniref:LysR family transcriptional regulator n=1 Tax=Pigmentiphaga litoralis TaxID=516702 RepID=UPI0016735AD6|nr:LysR family transcriptional regulator [Pigmentiphaga litoralis]GGX17117.1 LysR family transcriptional regulator [Pigmentiphaga litoralis]